MPRGVYDRSKKKSPAVEKPAKVKKGRAVSKKAVSVAAPRRLETIDVASKFNILTSCLTAAANARASLDGPGASNTAISEVETLVKTAAAATTAALQEILGQQDDENEEVQPSNGTVGSAVPLPPQQSALPVPPVPAS